MTFKQLQPKPKGETEAQRIKRFAATGDPRYIAVAKLWRAGVFPNDAETDFYTGRATMRCWRLQRDVSPLTKNGTVHRFRFVDVAGTSHIAADKDAVGKIRKFFSLRAKRLADKKYYTDKKEAAAREKARIKQWKKDTVAEMKILPLTALVDVANGHSELFRTQTASQELAARRARKAS
jgi:hypothetical protein